VTLGTHLALQDQPGLDDYVQVFLALLIVGVLVEDVEVQPQLHPHSMAVNAGAMPIMAKRKLLGPSLVNSPSNIQVVTPNSTLNGGASASGGRPPS
jgi:hypothetical protein